MCNVTNINIVAIIIFTILFVAWALINHLKNKVLEIENQKFRNLINLAVADRPGVQNEFNDLWDEIFFDDAEIR